MKMNFSCFCCWRSAYLPKTSTSMLSGAREESGSGIGVVDDGDLDLVVVDGGDGEANAW